MAILNTWSDEFGRKFFPEEYTEKDPHTLNKEYNGKDKSSRPQKDNAVSTR
jgi:hypothetical protein